MIAYSLDVAGSTARTHELGNALARGPIIRSIDTMQRGIEDCLDLREGVFEGQRVRVIQSIRVKRRGLEGDGVLFLAKDEQLAIELCRCILRALAEIPTELPIKAALDIGDAVWPPGREWHDGVSPDGLLITMVVSRLQSVAEPRTLVVGKSMYGRIEQHDAALRDRFAQRRAELRGIPGETDYWIAGLRPLPGPPIEKLPDAPAYQRLEPAPQPFASPRAVGTAMAVIGLLALAVATALYLSR